MVFYKFVWWCSRVDNQLKERERISELQNIEGHEHTNFKKIEMFQGRFENHM